MAAQIRGVVLFYQAKLDDAVLSLREAMGLFEAMGQPYDAALTAIDLANALRHCGQEGDRATAQALLRGAIETLQRLGARPDARKAAAILASGALNGYGPRQT